MWNILTNLKRGYWKYWWFDVSSIFQHSGLILNLIESTLNSIDFLLRFCWFSIPKLYVFWKGFVNLMTSYILVPDFGASEKHTKR